MRIFFKKSMLIGLVVVLASLLSGCFLRLLFGSVAARDSDFGTVFIAEMGGTWGPMAICDFDETGVLVDCSYTFTDFEADPPIIERTSSAQLLSEHGILGLFVDPLILQVPAEATHFAGTLDDGSGPQPFVITETSSFDVQPGTVVSAEAGQKFVILELPPDVVSELLASGELEGPFDFTFEFELPSLSDVDVKPMYTGKVEVDGRTFYVPLLPCVTDFASIPAVTIPANSTPVNLMPPIMALISQGAAPACDGQVYDFTADEIVVYPPVQAISPGESTTFSIQVNTNEDPNVPFDLALANPNPDLLAALQPDSVLPGVSATLTVTDTHPGPDLTPGIWYTLPLTATRGGDELTAEAQVLVGGGLQYLPVIVR